MFWAAFQQLGFDWGNLEKPELHAIEQDWGMQVFFVPQAAKSDVIPNQEDFVLRYGIQSVVGFGAQLLNNTGGHAVTGFHDDPFEQK